LQPKKKALVTKLCYRRLFCCIKTKEEGDNLFRCATTKEKEKEGDGKKG
jgi:hypothetical protein